MTIEEAEALAADELVSDTELAVVSEAVVGVSTADELLLEL